MKGIIKNVIILVVLLGSAYLFFGFVTSSSDMIGARPRPGGGYYFMYSGRRVWINRSFRHGSMTGRYRGGGPHAGK